MNIVGSLRTLVFLFREDKKWLDHWLWLAGFIVLIWIAAIIAWEGPITLLPVIAMTVETPGLWMKNPRMIRLISLFPRPLWFSYNLINGSWAGVATETMVFTSILVAIFRYDRKKTT
jgi:hypothetical protein